MKKSEWMKGLRECELTIKVNGFLNAKKELDNCFYIELGSFMHGWLDCINHYEMFLNGDGSYYEQTTS